VRVGALVLLASVARDKRAAEGPIPAELPLVEPESLGKPRRGCTVPIVGRSTERVEPGPAERGKVDQAPELSRELVALEPELLLGDSLELEELARGR
jgi:hypothetical protein